MREDLGASRAPRRRDRQARARRDEARDRPTRLPDDASPSSSAPRGDLAPARANRRRSACARRADDRRIVGYTNAGKSHAAQHAHGRRRLGREQTVRDARPDHPRLRARRPARPRHGHRRLHPPLAASARRGLRGDARGDSRRGPRAARRRRVAAGGTSRRATPTRWTACCTRSARPPCRCCSC